MFSLKKKKYTEDVQCIKDIVTKYSDRSDVKKLISPISDEYFLIDDGNQIYICIGDGKITFSNHIFLYTKNFPLAFTDMLKKNVKKTIEQEMQILKKSLFKNETVLLSKILGLADGKPNSQVISHNFNVQSL